MRLEISLFKFDCKSDYLPYYKKYFLKLSNEKTLLDILKTMNQEEEFSFEDDLESAVVLNGLYTDVSVSVKDIKKDFGNDLVIEPLSIKRSHSDLLIDSSDFEEKLDILDFINDDETKEEYTNYKKLFYASNTLNFEADYIGDAILLLAHSLIAKHKASQNKIINAIDCSQTGINFHTSLENRVYNYDLRNEDKINALKTKLKMHKVTPEKNYRINNTFIMNFEKIKKEDKIKHDFNGFNIAYYRGNNSCDKVDTLLNKLDAKILNLNSMTNDLAMDTFNVNQNFTYKLASHMMLDAFDNNADFLVVNDIKIYCIGTNSYLSSYYRASCWLVPLRTP